MPLLQQRATIKRFPAAAVEFFKTKIARVRGNLKF